MGSETLSTIKRLYRTATSLYLFLILIAVLIVLHRIKGGYSLAKIHSTLPPFSDWTPTASCTEVAPLLDQPFYFLSSGGTSFAFLGADGNTVLKLFKHQHLTPKSWLFTIRLPCDVVRIQKILSRESRLYHKRVSFFFTSCALAYQELKEETGMLFLSLHKDLRFQKKVQLIDRLGYALEVDLSQTEFALQRRATPLFDHLKRCIAENRFSDAKQAIHSLVHLLEKRCRKGLADRDPHLSLNFGYVDGRVIEYDIGSFSAHPFLAHEDSVKKELFFVTYELRQWLEERSPELLKEILNLLR